VFEVIFVYIFNCHCQLHWNISFKFKCNRRWQNVRKYVIAKRIIEQKTLMWIYLECMHSNHFAHSEFVSYSFQCSTETDILYRIKQLKCCIQITNFPASFFHPLYCCASYLCIKHLKLTEFNTSVKGNRSQPTELFYCCLAKMIGYQVVMFWLWSGLFFDRRDHIWKFALLYTLKK
jgi:hypothetical protein